jgi:hypothetical protein
MALPFKLGCNGRGALYTKELPVEEQFRLVKVSGVFDYFDRLPPRDQIREYMRCSAKFDLPIRTITWFYQLGCDSP